MKTSNINRVLIPVDFSPVTDCVVEQGAYLAKVYNADILLLHAVEGLGSYPHEWLNDKKPHEELIHKKISERLNKYANSIIKKYEILVKQVITTGNPTLKITEAVEKHKMDLIVMGSHGAEGVKDFFTDNNAHKVADLASCPVISVRLATKTTGFSNIVMPISNDLYSRQKVNNVIDLASKSNATVHILGLLEKVDSTEDNKFKMKLEVIEHALKAAGIKLTTKLIRAHNIANEAIKFSDEIGADLIIIMTDHESDLPVKFLGTGSRQIVNHSKIPVMSIRPTGKLTEAFNTAGEV